MRSCLPALVALVTLSVSAWAGDARLVLDAVPPAVPAWTFNNRNGILRLSTLERDGETVLCVSNPIPAKAASGQDTKTSWSVVSPAFQVRGGQTLELALRMISPGPEAGGAPKGADRTGVAWLDARGRELGFRSMSFPRDEPFLRTHVRRLAVPKDAVAARVSVGYASPEFPRDGHVFALASAKARLVGPETPPDAAFVETSVASLERLTPSPCEDAHAPIRLKIVSRHALDESSLVCTLDGAASDRIRRTGAELTVLPPDGGWRMPSFTEVSVTGRDVRGARFTDTQVCCFGTRVKQGVVTLRDDGMTLVDGQPFFPLGVYGVRCLKPADEPALDRLKAAKFNTVQSYIGGLEDLDWFLRAADRHGLKAIIEPAERNFCRPRSVLATAYALRTRPSLLTWYLGDDTATHQSALHLRQVGRYVKAADDAHVTSQSDSVLWRDLTLSRQTRLVGLTDVFIPQLYPAMKTEITGRETPEVTRDFLEYRRGLAAAGNPVTGIWPCLQGFRGYGSWPRYPTAAEQRAQAWLSIVRGACGLLWYLHHANGDGNVGLVDDPALWRIVTDVVAEIDRNKDDLVTRDAKVQPAVEVLEGEAKDELGFTAVNVLLKEGVSAPLLIAVNSSSRPITARIAVPGFPSETIAFPPLGVVVKPVVADVRAADYPTISAAIAACAERGGGRVVVGKGEHLSRGPVVFRSNVELHLEEGATVVFSDRLEDYLPGVRVAWEGIECVNVSPLVYAYGCTNVAITGKGTLKAKMDFWWTWAGVRNPDCEKVNQLLKNDWSPNNVPVGERQLWKQPNARFRPQFIHFNRCRNVRFEDFRLRGSPFWMVHVFLCDGVTARGLDIDATGDDGRMINNSDGFDIDATRNVLVERCTFCQGDDALVFKSGKDFDGRRLATPTENVTVRDCFVRKGHNLAAIGSELSGGVRNVRISGCRIEGSVGELLHIKTNPRRGGFVEDILVEDIEVGELRTDVIGLTMRYYFGCGGEEAFDRDYFTAVRGLTVRNVRCRRAPRRFTLRGDYLNPAADVTLENIRVDELAEADYVASVRNLTVDGRPYPATVTPARAEELGAFDLKDAVWNAPAREYVLAFTDGTVRGTVTRVSRDGTSWSEPARAFYPEKAFEDAAVRSAKIRRTADGWWLDVAFASERRSYFTPQIVWPFFPESKFKK